MSKLSNITEILNNLSEEELIEVLAQVDPVSFAEHTRILRGEPFSLKDRKYLHDIYRDESKKVILVKGRQVEGSETTLNLILGFLAKNPYTTALHCFPRQQQAETFSKTRLNTSIAESPYLNGWECKQGSQLVLRKFEKINKAKKKVEYNYYALTGTFAGGSAESGDSVRGLSTDLIAFDELQDMEAESLPTIIEGQSHSKFKRQLLLGTPKFTNDGLWKNWEVSDMKEWFVKCPNCGEEIAITYDTILNAGDDLSPVWYYGCTKCGTELNRRLGYWKSTNENCRVGYSGYHLTQLIVPWITAEEIKEKEVDPNYSRRRFMNEVLGLAYVGDDVPLTESMLKECMTDYALGDIRYCSSVYVGCDWGKNGSYCTVMNEKGKLVDLFESHHVDSRQHPVEIARYLARYKGRIRRCVVDFGPDLAYFNNFRDSLKEFGIHTDVYACKYMTPPQSTEEKWNDNDKMVNVGRSEIIETLIDRVTRQNIHLPAKSQEDIRMKKFITHCCNMASETNQTSSGNQFIQFISLGDDHYMHSTIYAILASKGATPEAIGSSADSFSNPRKDRNDTKLHRNSKFVEPKYVQNRTGDKYRNQNRVRKARRHR